MLTRRTRISIETFDRGVAAARDVAPLMGEVLGWDDDALAREIEHYEARVAAEVESQRRPDDHTADAARMGALPVPVQIMTMCERGWLGMRKLLPKGPITCTLSPGFKSQR